MISHAEASVFWPGITNDIKGKRSKCHHCNVMAPSQPLLPPTPPPIPEYPFQLICSDFFHHKGNNYLISVDRYSNWPIVERSSEGSRGLINSLRRNYVTYGIPDELSSDGGPEFIADNTKNFLKSWGVRHRISSVAFPHSNCRAEVGVKTVKRMIVGNTGPNGELDTDAFQCAMLTYRNTPDPGTGISPAMCIFGRPTRSTIPILPGKYLPHPTWQDTLQKREDALRTRHFKIAERLSLGTRHIPPLRVGDHVRLQNQIGPNPRKWDKTGRVVEVKQHDQYVVRVDGSGRVTLRNRKFLRQFTPVMPSTIPDASITYPLLQQTTSQLIRPRQSQARPAPSPDSREAIQDDTLSLPKPLVSSTPSEDIPINLSPTVASPSRPATPRPAVTSNRTIPVMSPSVRKSTRTRKPPPYLEDYER